MKDENDTWLQLQKACQLNPVKSNFVIVPDINEQMNQTLCRRPNATAGCKHMAKCAQSAYPEWFSSSCEPKK